MKKHLFIIPLRFSWNWTTDYYKQTALELNKKCHSVIFYNAFDLLTPNNFFSRKSVNFIYKLDGFLFYTPIELLPFRRFMFIKMINTLINEILFISVLITFNFSNVLNRTIILHCFSPDDVQLSHLFKLAKLAIYDCVDYPGSLDLRNQKLLRKRENQLIKNVDFFFTISKVLRAIHKPIRKATLVPQGFRVQSFIKASDAKKKNFPIDKPIIGFVGGINYRLDFQLLNSVISKNEDKNFVLWGPILPDYQNTINSVSTQLKKLKKHPNLFFGHSDKQEEIPTIISQFDIAIIPYDITQEFNQYCYPMKLFEYFYMGKPVLTTPIQELLIRKEFHGLLYIGNSEKDWQDTIDRVLKKSWPKKKSILQKEFAMKNSWEKKITKILDELNE